MKLLNKSKIEVFITVTLKNKIKIYAKEKGISVAEVIRRSLEGMFK